MLPLFAKLWRPVLAPRPSAEILQYAGARDDGSQFFVRLIIQVREGRHVGGGWRLGERGGARVDTDQQQIFAWSCIKHGRACELAYLRRNGPSTWVEVGKRDRDVFRRRGRSKIVDLEG